jgi:hypothetical protein
MRSLGIEVLHALNNYMYEYLCVHALAVFIREKVP